VSGKESVRDDLAVVVGTGHLGVNLAKALVDQGRRVRVVAYGRDPMLPEFLSRMPVEIRLGDVSDKQSLFAPFEGASVVYNATGYINIRKGGWGRLKEINVDGVENVIRAAAEKGVQKVICFSSIHAIEQRPLDRVLDESRPLVQMSKDPCYNHSKAEGESLARKLMAEDGLVDGCILIPTGMMGPMDHVPSEFGEVLLKLAQGRMSIMVDAGMDWVDIRDVASAALKAEKVAKTGERFVLSGHYVALRETAGVVEEVTGVPAPEKYLPLWVARAAAPLALKYAEMVHQRPAFTPYSMEALKGNRMISHQHATEVLGFEPRPHRETVIDSVEWLLKHHRQ